MVQTVYNDADFMSAVAQRKKILGVFFAVTFAYVAFCVGWMIYFISLP